MDGERTVRIVINGTELMVPEGEKIIESARRIGVDIPHFCYHPRLSGEAGANCRMCLVEVSAPRKNPDGSVTLAKYPKPQTSCSLPASEGMVIETETPTVIEARRAILEFLLINHPLDCPICDRGGECPLQNNTIHYGPPTTRYVEPKRHKPKAWPLSEHVVLDRERCIHCARCTRFTEDISGDAQLGFLKRGADMEVSPHTGTQLTSLFSGNTIELCPVGALLSRSYRFRARPWDLATERSICTQCSNGCNIKIDHRDGRLVRVNARVNEAVNEEWTCDRGKFGMAYVNEATRLAHPLIREGGAFRTATWDEAVGLTVSRLRDAGSSAALIGGSRSSNEDIFALQRLFREILGSPNLDHRMGPWFPSVAEPGLGGVGRFSMVSSIVDLERQRNVLVFGSDMARDLPMLFLRIRKGWRAGATRVSVVEIAAGAAEDQHLRPIAMACSRIERRDAANAAWELASTAASTYGDRLAQMPRAAAAAAALRGWSGEDAVLGPELALSIVRSLAEGTATIIVGREVRAASDADDVVDALAVLAAATGATLDAPVHAANEQGALDLGLVPDAGPGLQPVPLKGMNTKSILRGVSTGEVRAIWVAGVDLACEYHSPDEVAGALEACPFLVVSALALNQTAQRADVVFPVAPITERSGTFTNVERRVQRFRQAYTSRHDVRSEWQIAAQVAARLGSPLPYASPDDVLNDMAQTVPTWSICSGGIDDEGVRCPAAQEGEV